MRVYGVVARIPKPRECGTAHGYGGRIQRHHGGIHLQTRFRYLHTAEIKFVDERIGAEYARAYAVEALRPAHSGVQPGSHIGGDILAVCISPRKRHSQLPVPVKMGVLINDTDLLFEQAVGGLQRGRLLPSEQIIAGDIEHHAGTDAGAPARRTLHAAGDIPCAVVLGRTGLGLEPCAVGQRPAPRFDRMKENSFLGFAPAGILDRRIDLIEKRKVVEIFLGFFQSRLVQRIAGM